MRLLLSPAIMRFFNHPLLINVNSTIFWVMFLVTVVPSPADPTTVDFMRFPVFNHCPPSFPTGLRRWTQPAAATDLRSLVWASFHVLKTSDHKTIGRLYLIFGFFGAIVAVVTLLALGFGPLEVWINNPTSVFHQLNITVYNTLTFAKDVAEPIVVTAAIGPFAPGYPNHNAETQGQSAMGTHPPTSPVQFPTKTLPKSDLSDYDITFQLKALKQNTPNPSSFYESMGGKMGSRSSLPPKEMLDFFQTKAELLVSNAPVGMKGHLWLQWLGLCQRSLLSGFRGPKVVHHGKTGFGADFDYR
jgi:hypothetical protein